MTSWKLRPITFHVPFLLASSHVSSLIGSAPPYFLSLLNYLCLLTFSSNLWMTSIFVSGSCNHDITLKIISTPPSSNYIKPTFPIMMSKTSFDLTLTNFFSDSAPSCWTWQFSLIHHNFPGAASSAQIVFPHSVHR